MLLGFILSIGVPVVIETPVTPHVAVAQAANGVEWQAELSNGGPIKNGTPDPVICASLPCNVDVKINNPTVDGKTIESVDWYPVGATGNGATPITVTTGPDFATNWHYDQVGRYDMGLGVHFTDHTSAAGGGSMIDVRDPVDQNATVAYVGSTDCKQPYGVLAA